MVRESWMGGTPPPVQHKPGTNDSRQPITPASQSLIDEPSQTDDKPSQSDGNPCPTTNDSRQPITARLTIRMAAKNGWRESPYTNNL